MFCSRSPGPRHFTVFVLFAASVFSAEAGFSSADPLPDLADFEGDWSQVDPDVDRASRMSAIDHAVNGLSWVVRKMAAPVLRRSTAPPPRIQFIWDGEKLVQRVTESRGESARAVELDADAHPGLDSRGEPMMASWQWTDSGLQLSWAQTQAHGHNVYRVDPESKTLVVQHTIHVTAISDVEPIIFESRFGRQEPPAVSAELDSTGTAASSE